MFEAKKLFKLVTYETEMVDSESEKSNAIQS